jgi:hypothetical protein
LKANKRFKSNAACFRFIGTSSLLSHSRFNRVLLDLSQEDELMRVRYNYFCPGIFEDQPPSASTLLTLFAPAATAISTSNTANNSVSFDQISIGFDGRGSSIMEADFSSTFS